MAARQAASAGVETVARTLLAVLAAALVATRAWGADTYTLDTAHSLPVFSFSHLGLTTQSGRFDRAIGTLELDLAARRGRVEYEVDASSLNMGFGAESPDSPGVRLFKVERFPKITFSSSQLVFDPQGRIVSAEGRLTLLGVGRPITLEVANFQCSASALNRQRMCSAEITAVIKRSQFGMLEYLPAISDEITIHVPVEAYRNPAR